MLSSEYLMNLSIKRYCSRLKRTWNMMNFNLYLSYEVVLLWQGSYLRNLETLGAWYFFSSYTSKFNKVIFFYLFFTHFMPLVYLYNPCKYQKSCVFLMFSGGIERNRWHEMNQSNYGSAGLVRKYFTLNSCNDANKEVLAISFLSNYKMYCLI